MQYKMAASYRFFIYIISGLLPIIIHLYRKCSRCELSYLVKIFNQLAVLVIISETKV